MMTMSGRQGATTATSEREDAGAATESRFARLKSLIPGALIVTGSWLKQRGYPTQLQNRYARLGWLTQPARGLFRLGTQPLAWQHVVASIQFLKPEARLTVGGRLALALHGLAETQEFETILLHGEHPPPNWVRRLPIRQAFSFRNSLRLCTSMSPLEPSHTVALRLREADPPIGVSIAERAALELMNELPDRDDFGDVDTIMAGLGGLRSSILQDMLSTRCRNIKAKRLLLFFADRHGHPWLRELDMATIDLGSGKRVLIRGGRFDPKYRITVPSGLADRPNKAVIG